MKIAVVGATGMVGQVMLKVMEEMELPVEQLIPVASSKGRKVTFKDEEIPVVEMEDALAQKPDIAIFSAGSEVSKKYACEFAQYGFVIDNSSAWRMDSAIPLVVPEINSSDISLNTKIIANPNCSTIQMVLALWPLQRNYGIERVVVSTYQSVTGSGVKGLKQLLNEREQKEGEKCYPHPIDLNLLPHGGDFLRNGYTTEEMKLVNETRKILHQKSMAITATVVRVPVKGGHSESINVRMQKDFDLEDVRRLMKHTPGLVVLDDPEQNSYPMPIHSEGKNEVFVGRLRRDESEDNSLNMWVVADNLRKGAATNAVQIAQHLIEKYL
jgi:aspartate-semialdehyde dehydrogenase